MPHLSPKKSVEGAIGGITGAALVGLLYGFILHKALGIKAMIPFLVISAVGAFISILETLQRLLSSVIMMLRIIVILYRDTEGYLTVLTV